MIAALALAAALQQPGDVYTDDAGCRWKRRPVATKPSKATSKEVPKAKKRIPFKARPADPADEFIGCDPEGFAVFRSDLEDIPTISVETFEAALELVPPVSEKRTEISDSFEEACQCANTGYPAFGGGGWSFVGAPRPVAPVPEPGTWLLLGAGLLFLLTRRRA